MSGTMEAIIGQDILLPCVATGIPDPTITWTKDGGSLEHNMIPSSAGLHIYSVSNDDDGQYTCTAVNEVNFDQQDIFLSVSCKGFINEYNYTHIHTHT